MVGPDTCRLDGDVYRGRFGVIGVDKAVRGHIGEVAAHRHHAQMPGGELDLRVIRVKLPDSCGCALRIALCRHVMSSNENETGCFYHIREQTMLLLPLI